MHWLHAALVCAPIIVVGCVPGGHDGPVNGKPLPLPLPLLLLPPHATAAIVATKMAKHARKIVISIPLKDTHSAMVCRAARTTNGRPRVSRIPAGHGQNFERAMCSVRIVVTLSGHAQMAARERGFAHSQWCPRLGIVVSAGFLFDSCGRADPRSRAAWAGSSVAYPERSHGLFWTIAWPMLGRRVDRARLGEGDREGDAWPRLPRV
jgi:hypothetical protein